MRYGEFTYELFSIIMEVSNEKTNNLMIYHEKRVRLPKPKYIVFYNGTKNQPDSMELRLSDCFENTDNEAPCWNAPQPC